MTLIFPVFPHLIAYFMPYTVAQKELNVAFFIVYFWQKGETPGNFFKSWRWRLIFLYDSPLAVKLPWDSKTGVVKSIIGLISQLESELG